MYFCWQVSTLYSDPSIGNAINVAVVDIVHLGTLATTPDADLGDGKYKRV